MKALRVMIVEDEMLLALNLEDMLLDAGYTVVGQASDMPQALGHSRGRGRQDRRRHHGHKSGTRIKRGRDGRRAEAALERTVPVRQLEHR